MKLTDYLGFVVLWIAIALICSGCDAYPSGVNINSIEEHEKIPYKSLKLIADKDTGIIYIENTTVDGYKVYTPYYSSNGNLCKFDDGKVIEIEDDN